MMAQATQEYRKLVTDAEEIVNRSGGSREDKLQEICKVLADEVEAFDWVGFYLVDTNADRELVLGPYLGEETDHTRIPFGKGICGQSAETNETFVVQDVSKADNYLSCSIHVKAEIVVPIKKNGDFVAQIDIDSHQKNSITDDHRAMLEEICDIASKLF